MWALRWRRDRGVYLTESEVGEARVAGTDTGGADDIGGLQDLPGRLGLELAVLVLVGLHQLALYQHRKGKGSGAGRSGEVNMG